MRNLLSAIVLSLVLTAGAHAHIQEGTWVGKTAEGAACSMKVIRQYFESETPHPLNERIVIQIGADEFTVGHPAVINAAESKASFDHDLFQGVLATKTGAKALVITMLHEEGKEGPTSFSAIEHQWKADTRAKVECGGLTLQR